jgi:26S proteasome regulatory subunit N9
VHGDVDVLEKISTEYADAIGKQPTLVNRAEVVKEKITLLALVNMIFERPSSERTLTFEDIGKRTKMPIEKVELIIMRALSLGLIKGSMDQVDQTVDVTWVMPRVLDGENMRQLANRFGEWAVKVSKTREFMTDHVPVTFG